jgi:hypothetical protein
VIEVLHFVFESPWRFIGSLMLLSVIVFPIAAAFGQRCRK